MSADVGKGLGAAAGSGIEPGADGGELGTGDGGLGVKGCGAASLHETQPRYGRDGGIGPVAVRHIGIGVTGKKIFVPDAVFQQTEEDGGGFRTGDQAVRFHQTILIADDISKMVGAIQHIGRRGAVVSHRFGFSDGCALACVEIVFRDLMLRAIQYIAFGSGDLDIVPVAAIAGNAVHAEQSNAAFRAVLGCIRCCSVDCFAIAAVLVQCKSSAVQCMAVLRIDLFNGKIVVGGGGAFATAGIFVPLGIQDNIPCDRTRKVIFGLAGRISIPTGKFVSIIHGRGGFFHISTTYGYLDAYGAAAL